jgi:hypothetical protein
MLHAPAANQKMQIVSNAPTQSIVSFATNHIISSMANVYPAIAQS